MIKRCFFAVFITLAANFGLGQTHEPRFDLITGADGITPGRINGMTRDPQGVMWFSDQTNRGIIRYDGTHMKRFQNDPKDSNSLGGQGYPECLAVDANGIIWIGFFNRGGVDRFDPVTGKFTHFRHSDNDPGSLANNTVSAILVDHLGNVCVGSDGGLDILDPHSGRFRHYHHDAADSRSLSYNIVRALYEDREGTLWVGTGSAFEPESYEGGLNRFDRTTGTFTRYLHDPNNPRSLIDNKVRAIFEDSRGTFWVGTSGDGLHTMDRKSGLFDRLTYDPADPGKLSRPVIRGIYDHITFITEDPQSQIWIGTFGNGITRYDPATKRVTHFGSTADRVSGLRDNDPWWAYVSKDGLFWVSTQDDNLYSVDMFTNIISFDRVNFGIVNGIVADFDGIQWFGTDSGLVRKDPLTGKTKTFKNDPLNANSISSNVIFSLSDDQHGNLWLGTSAGLNRFNPKSGIITRFAPDRNNSGSLGGDIVGGVYLDAASNVWCYPVGKGIDRLDPQTGLFTHFVHIPGDTTTISSNLVSCLLEGQPGELWISHWDGGGLNRMDTRTGIFKQYLPQKSVNTIFKDRNNTLWVGAADGLFRYDRKVDNFLQLNLANAGLDINSVWSIVGDDHNNLWIGSFEGIYKFNPEKKEAIFYGKESGIHSQSLNNGSVCRMKDGQLIFGALFGYYSFYPERFTNSPLQPKIQFTDFWLGNQAVKPGQNSVLGAPISSVKQIFLRYDQNLFSFIFDAIDYGIPADKKVIYKMDNYDKEWREPGSDSRALYFDVPPGKYVFRVKAVNTANGIWQEKDITVIISPPWWKRWWAYTLYAVILIFLAVSLDRFQKARILKAERERNRAREIAQAKEIEKAYHELKLTQAQLIQSEKMASLGELTAGIAHEIQNPLNFVNNFSEINSELIKEMKDEINKGNLQEVKSLADNIDENEQKIVHHGKRADAIVKGMLQHSRSTGNIKEPTDINALADEYLRLSYHGLRAKDKSFNAEFSTDFQPNITKINIVPQDIGRVILNLINNAFYAVADKKKTSGVNYAPTVIVSTKKTGDKVAVSVKDNGNGVPQKVIDKIFQPFFTTKPAGVGTGLGLSLSYDIVKSHGGEITVSTKESEGSEFVILLPVS